MYFTQDIPLQVASCFFTFILRETRKVLYYQVERHVKTIRRSSLNPFEQPMNSNVGLKAEEYLRGIKLVLLTYIDSMGTR